MKIDISELGAKSFRFERPVVGGGGGAIELSAIDKLTGHYVADETGSSIHDARASTLRVDRATWHIGAGQVEGSNARLGSVELGLSIPKGAGKTSLRLAVAQVTLDRVVYAVRNSTVIATADLEGALVERDPDGRLAIACVRLHLRNLEISHGALEIAAKEVDLHAASIIVHKGELRIKAGRVAVSGVAIKNDDVTVSIHRLEAPSGLVYANGDITADEVAAGSIEVVTPIGRSRHSSRAPVASAAKKALPDLSVLDGLDGQIDLDLTVDATIPLLKSRRATHYFRIPVHRGAINFRGLERDLSLLEDAVLDFKVKDGELILEKDIPFIPFDNTTLVAWPLVDATDRDLAERKMVRLRRLADYRLPVAKKKKKAEDSSFALRELDFGNIDARLRLADRGTIRFDGWTLDLGAPEVAAIESLTVSGQLRYLAQGKPHPGRLEIKGRGITLGLTGLPVGTSRLSCTRLVLGEVPLVRADFSALAPQRLAAKLGQVRVLGLKLVAGSR